MNSPFGIVICGFGSAGRSRLQAINQMPEFELKGIVSRRADLATISFDNALADPNIHVIAISTENADHPSRVLACLEANKHVLCDYPLAFSTVELSALLALAESRQKILHIEQIGLLSGWHDEMKKKLSGYKKILSLAFKFTAKLTSISGPPAFLPYPRLLQLFDWFGILQLLDFSLNQDQAGFLFQSHWLSEQNIPLSFEERRSNTLPRMRSLSIQTETGTENFPLIPKPEGLFLQDLQYFKQRLMGTISEPYYNLDHVTTLTQILSRAVKQGLVTQKSGGACHAQLKMSGV